MDICREQSPPLQEPATGAGSRSRLASCWLQDGEHEVPAELALPDPGSPDELSPILPNARTRDSGIPASTAAAGQAASPEPGSLA